MNAPTILIDWTELKARYQVQDCAHAWVSDESIARALQDLKFDDPRVPHHEGTHRANRIASIVSLMEDGFNFDPLKLRVRGCEVHIYDGHHRLRAYQYRRRLSSIPVYVAS